MSDKWSSREFVQDAVKTECLKHGIGDDAMTQILWNAAEDIVRGENKFHFIFQRIKYGFGGTQSDPVYMTIVSINEEEAEKKAKAMSPTLPPSGSYGFNLIEIKEIG